MLNKIVLHNKETVILFNIEDTFNFVRNNFTQRFIYTLVDENLLCIN
jgi:hypothetical protein